MISWNDVNETADVRGTDTQSYRFNHSMIRVKDAEASLKFYQQIMGMKLVRTHESPGASFNLYFLGYDTPTTPESQAQREGIRLFSRNY